MRPLRLALVHVFCATVLGSAVAAQSSRTSALSFGINAGRSTPISTVTDDFYDSGFQLGGLAELRIPVSWLAVRIDAGYQRLGKWPFITTNFSGDSIGNGDVSTGMISGTANLVIRVPSFSSPVRPYALAGFGSYWLRQHLVLNVPTDPSAARNDTHSMRVNGYDAGLGLEAPLAHIVIFGEARYQSVGPAPLRFLPISLGVRLP